MNLRSFGNYLFIGLFSALFVLMFIGCGEDEEQEEVGEKGTLLSMSVSAPPVVDGQEDNVWKDAKEVATTATGGANAGFHAVSIKSVHTASDIYFLVQWDDPTESLERFPWEKQADGTWKKLETPNAKSDENKWYEDKLAILWDINNSIKGFESTGCTVACHLGAQGKAFGYKTAPAGGLGDIWHWKSVRTGPVERMDDQYLDDTPYDPNVNSGEAGRKSDPSEGGGYKDNVNNDKTGPAYTSPTQPAPPYWILDTEKQPFADKYAKGDRIAGMITAPYTGDRGNINAKGVYAAGKWTLEMGRKLDTGSKYDVQFTASGTEYPFGVAVFDNAQVRHSWTSEALKMKLEQ